MSMLNACYDKDKNYDTSGCNENNLDEVTSINLSMTSLVMKRKV